MTDGCVTSSVNCGVSASESIEARMLRDSLGSRVGIGGVAAATGGVEGVATGEGRCELLLDLRIPMASTEAGRAGCVCCHTCSWVGGALEALGGNLAVPA